MGNLKLKPQSILNFSPPGMTARPWQKEVLLEIERTWEANDVFVIPGSVGFGKSFIAMTLANWIDLKYNKSVAVCTPRVALQEQYQRSFPNVPVLKGKSRYKCDEMEDYTCEAMYETGGYCGTCSYVATREAVKKSNQAVFNFSSYLYNKEQRNVLIVDEAHLLHDFLQDENTMQLWRHKEKFPDDMTIAGDVSIWLTGEIQKLSKALAKVEAEIIKAKALEEPDAEALADLGEEKVLLSRKLDKYGRVRRGIEACPTNYFIERERAPYGLRRDIETLLRVRPETLRGLPPILWGRKTDKIILLSGTISNIDLRRLSLNHDRRVKWLDTYNPIPAEQRPVSTVGAINMSWKHQDKNLPAFVAKLNEIMSKQPSSGIVHVTYGLAEKLRKHLTDDRFMWHTKENKEQVLEEFLQSEGRVLIACGMAEGLDLAGEQFGWQVIGKIMYPSKKDNLIDKWYNTDPEWINWLAVRTTLQQCGRICRGPDDFGITYILDSTFGNLEKKRFGLVTKNRDMFPDDFLDSIYWRK